MIMTKNNNYSDRLNSAINAKADLLQRFRKATAAPDLAAKLAAREDVARARDARRIARVTEKQAEQQRAMAEAASAIQEETRRQAAEHAASEERQLAQDKRLADVLSDEAARKNARDLRYAKRKAAQIAA